MDLVLGKIPAIKVIRAITGCGLKVAKDALDWAQNAGSDIGESDDHILIAALLVARNDLEEALKISTRSNHPIYRYAALRLYYQSPPEGG